MHSIVIQDNKPKKQAVVCDIVNIEQKDPQDGIFPFVVHFRKLPKWTLAASNEASKMPHDVTARV